MDAEAGELPYVQGGPQLLRGMITIYMCVTAYDKIKVITNYLLSTIYYLYISAFKN